MDRYETTARYNIAETCSASISINDLVNLSPQDGKDIISRDTKLTYGAIRGSDGLRANIALLYPSEGNVSKENVLITPGAISANFLLLYTLLAKGDHVICHYPTYQQLYSVPLSLGAEVTLWRAQERQNWALDPAELENLIKENTKLIILNNPQNPTGAIIPKATLEKIVDVARKHNLIVLSDEVYRPLFHSLAQDDKELPPSILSMGYPHAVATGSMSKAFALAGLRLGWIASTSRDIIENCAEARHYTTISVSQVDDQVAAFALSPTRLSRLLARNVKLAQTNLQILEQFVNEHKAYCSWVRPSAGTTAFLKFSRDGKPVDDVSFCTSAIETKGIMFVPGSHCFGHDEDFKGYVRIGFCCETNVLVDGLHHLRSFMSNEFARVDLVT